MTDPPAPTAPFEQLRHTPAAGGEYWSGRELASIRGDTQWRNVVTAVEQAQRACLSSGPTVSDHFAEASKMVTLGSGAQRPLWDWHLSRYAGYLVVQHADLGKAIGALGQTYLAVQTRRAAEMDALAAHETQRAGTARDAGVSTRQDFAIFPDPGYLGLYAGERARAIARRTGLPPGRPILG